MAEEDCAVETMGQLTTFYRGKKVFLTGHTGFKGTWLSLLLERLGAEVYGYALLPDTPFFDRAAPHLARSYEGQMADGARVKEALAETKPDLVFHLAAHSTLTKSYDLTEYIFHTNVMGTVNLLEGLRGTPSVGAALIVTSDKCYKNMESDVPYGEDSPLGAQDPYSTSKACQDLVTECYRKSFFGRAGQNLPVATARASNVIGGGDYHFDRLLPGILQSFLRGEAASIRNGDAVRPWQYVLDVLEGYLLLAKALYESKDGDSPRCGAYNFGPEADGIVTVRELTARAAAEFPYASFTENRESAKVAETKMLKISSRKAKDILHWQRRHTFRDAVQETASFAKREQAGEAVAEICRDFIERSGIY